MRIQMAGLAIAGGRNVSRGVPGAGGFSVLQIADGRLSAAFSIDAPADHIAARRLIQSGDRIDIGKACDPSIPLKQGLSDSPATASA